MFRNVATRVIDKSQNQVGHVEGETLQLELNSQIDISSVMELRQQLAATLEQGLPITLAFASVERMDTAAVQLIYAFANHAKDRGIEISWQGMTDGMEDAFRFAGLASWLNECVH